MSKITEFMGRDHKRLDGIFNEFRRLKDRDLNKAGNLFSDFKTGLERHIVWEEEILFPAFEDRTGMYSSGPTAVMRMEHRQIKEFLEEIQGRIQKQDLHTGEFEEALIRILSQHDQKEEAVLYPWIDRSLSDEERGEIILKIKKSSPEKHEQSSG